MDKRDQDIISSLKALCAALDERRAMALEAVRRGLFVPPEVLDDLRDDLGDDVVDELMEAAYAAMKAAN